VALALPRWPLPSVLFPARFSAIFATALGSRPSDMQPFSVSVARYGKLPSDVEVSRISRRKRAIPIKLI
jgi:hypothetical protein